MWKSNLPKWTTSMFVNGPINVERDLSFISRKDIDYENPLYSNIFIRNERDGVQLSVNSFASNLDLAKKAALVYSGLGLDVLSLITDCTLYVSLHKKRSSFTYSEYDIIRTVSEKEWKTAFQESRLLRLTAPTFLRALGWYRKGLNSEDPFDKFLAFWNSIEVVATKYHTKNQYTIKGTKNQVWQCFCDLWGECQDWKEIGGQQEWIDNNYEDRNNVAHGIIPIDVSSIERIIGKLDILQKLANVFLCDWREFKLLPETKITPEISAKLEEKNWVKLE